MSARHGLSTLCCLLALACSDTKTIPATAVLVTIDAGPMVRERIETLTVSISRGATPDELDPRGEEVFEIDGDFHWPASLTLVANDSDVRAFGLAVTAETSSEKLVVVRAISEFVEGKTLLLEMFVPDECVGYLDCDEEQTCRVADGRPECGTARLPRLPELDQNDLTRLREGQRPDAGLDAGPETGDDSGTQDAGTKDSGTQDGGAKDAGPRDLGDASTPVDSGTTDSGTDSGRPPPEDCWNGMDDDGDGDVDCADSACAATATCAPAGSTIAVLVDVGTTCPAGYREPEQLIYSGFMAGGCEGCNCGSAGPTSCRADVYYYTSMATCTADVARAGGTNVGTVSTGPCANMPFSPTEPSGWRVSTFSVTPGTCAASGTPSLAPNAWMTSKKLCVTAQVGGGCDAGFACVPATTAKVCGKQASGGQCPAGSSASNWFDGVVTDSRQCGACECTASGASCDAVQARMGSDWVCGDSPKLLSSGGQDCTAANYSPPVSMIGTPTPATCTPRSAVSGTAMPTGPVNLCCAP